MSDFEPLLTAEEHASLVRSRDELRSQYMASIIGPIGRLDDREAQATAPPRPTAQQAQAIDRRFTGTMAFHGVALAIAALTFSGVWRHELVQLDLRRLRPSMAAIGMKPPTGNEGSGPHKANQPAMATGDPVERMVALVAQDRSPDKIDWLASMLSLPDRVGEQAPISSQSSSSLAWLNTWSSLSKPETSVVSALSRILKRGDEQERATAANLLGLMPRGHSAFTELQTAALDSDLRVRVASAAAICKIDPELIPQYAQVFIDGLSDGDKRTHMDVLDALASADRDNPSVERGLTDIARETGGSEEAANLALFLLKDLKINPAATSRARRIPVRGRDVLIGSTFAGKGVHHGRDIDPKAFNFTMRLCAQFGGEFAKMIYALIEAQSDQNSFVRAAAAIALRLLQHTETGDREPAPNAAESPENEPVATPP
jgi:hypothetical protein